MASDKVALLMAMDSRFGDEIAATGAAARSMTLRYDQYERLLLFARVVKQRYSESDAPAAAGSWGASRCPG